MTHRFQCGYVLQEINTSLSLVDYYHSFAEEEYSFLLDSGMDPQKLGRFSFAGRKPFLIFKSKGDDIEVITEGNLTRKRGNPFIELRNLLSQYHVDPADLSGSPIPFLGGAVGYFGYELCYLIEKLPSIGSDDLGLPDCYFMLVNSVTIFDHLENKMYISAIGFDEQKSDAIKKARESLESLRNDIEHFERENASKKPSALNEKEFGWNQSGSDIEMPEFRAMFNEDQYMEVVRKAKEHIFAGDIFEVCTTHRFECDFEAKPFELYRELRRINPAPFASYLNFPEVKVVSASPERFLQVGRDGWCKSRPIKGTRPRGKKSSEDKKLYRELLSSIKDRAENMMIVDLVRNDFGRVCKFNSVEVSELMVIEKYATVFQMVSTIIGQLEDEYDCFDIIKACFPGGSMTGAPKIEAMSIIDSLEPVKRGIYSGSIGYLDFSGNVDLNIVIRTILIKEGKAYFQVGGAVVADSDPRDEYLETLHKAKALIRSLRNVLGRTQSAVPMQASTSQKERKR